MTTFRAQYPSTFESVAEARRAVGQFAQVCGFGSADISDIVLAVGEACSNAAEHGHMENGFFAVQCTFEQGSLRTQIADRGSGFDLRKADRVMVSADAESRGRGIPIMRALMDAVTYDAGDNGTTVRLVKTKDKSHDEPRLARRVGEPSAKGSGFDSRSPG